MGTNLSGLEEWIAINRADVVDKYVLQGWTLEYLMKRTKEEYGLGTTKTKWKIALKSAGISKYIRPTEAFAIRRRLQQLGVPGASWWVLPIVDGVLLDIMVIENYHERTKKDPQFINTANQRHIVFVDLSFEYRQLKDPPTFELVRKVIWLIGVYFDLQFKEGAWKADERGLINRSERMVSDLKALSQIHNIIVDALRCQNKKKVSTATNLLRKAMWRLEEIVTTTHHRQITDILAIIYLTQQFNQPYNAGRNIQTILCNQLNGLAVKYLSNQDPRQNLFQTFKEIPPRKDWDPDGHFLAAIDSFCRRLWMGRAGLSDIRAYYSYNQASFPRAQPGDFFMLFKGKQVKHVLSMLEEIDHQFDNLDHVNVTLWHTALHYFFEEERLGEAEGIASLLVQRFLPLETFVHFTTEQLNFDAAKTFLLRARIFEEQSKIASYHQEAEWKARQALCELQQSLQIRRLLIPSGVWDALSKSILIVLISVTDLLGRVEEREHWEKQLQIIYDNLDLTIESETN